MLTIYKNQYNLDLKVNLPEQTDRDFTGVDVIAEEEEEPVKNNELAS